MQGRKITTRDLVYIFIFIFPILPLYFQVAGINGINIVCALFVFGTLMLKRFKTRIYVEISFVSAALALWFISQCIELVISGAVMEVLWYLLRTVGVYWTLKLLVESREDFLECIKISVYAGGVLSFFGILEEVTHFNIFSLLSSSSLNYNPLRFGILRILSFASHTIAYGVYLMFVMSLCLYYMQFIRSERKNQKMIFRIIYALMWINLLLTLSRSSILVAIVSQVWILYASGARKFFRILFRMLTCFVVLYVLLLIFLPQTTALISNIGYMMLALFDDRFTSIIAQAFGDDNLYVVGNRIDLYTWVADTMRGHWFFGHGFRSTFHYGYSVSNKLYMWTQYKDSIEVQYLATLYRYGIVGLLTEVLTYIALILSALKGRLMKCSWEPNLSFSMVGLSVFVCYVLQMFSVNQSSDRNICYLFVFLFLIYCSKKSVFEGEGH